ncbi:hypothetical protein MIC97_14590 [Aquamicrobium sp. NLF2-7]|uniref:hypothetical protein n=1 Tax=Aquamicrobium sp. NLF2-7 TaxID=2918753 RepID=UPI001EFB1A17|nr:hypothetical protein [Aquamicrobium sp. NLF2-7]MCG8272726.1 hypothetical protein [Aquamicrobium sp. NLF2-7]
MVNRPPQQALLEARFSEVTSYRPTVQELDIIMGLVETARKPFGTMHPTGDDPATHFLPIAAEGKETTL